MLVFPQLATGASGLYPITKQAVQRTVVNTLGDGKTDVYSDADAAITAWELPASGLTLAESSAIEALFQATSGMWQTFTFLDPAGNLLADSEDFSASGWSNGGLVSLTPNIGDPLGTNRATRVVNGGSGAESIAQTLQVPGNFHYCLSVWARTTAGSSVALTISTTGANVTKVFALTPAWQRIFVSANPAQGTTSVTFRADLEAAASVELFGMQAEPQLGPSDYKKTGTRNGVYSKARFASDQLIMTALGTDVYDSVIRIVNTES